MKLKKSERYINRRGVRKTQITKVIEERNELLGKVGNTAVTVRMSAEIRGKLKNIRKQAEELAALQKKDQEKLDKKKAKVINLARI